MLDRKTEALGTIIKIVLSNSLLLTQVVCAKVPNKPKIIKFSLSLFISLSLFLSLSLSESLSLIAFKPD